MNRLAEWHLIARVVQRIGVKKLWLHKQDSNRWAVSLDNKTYHRWFEIPEERIPAWMKAFDR